MAAKKALPVALSFSGCGFLGVYHIGIVRSFQIYGPEFLSTITKFAGASAGSLAAAVLAICPEKVPLCKRLTYDMALMVKKQILGAFKPGFRLATHLEKMVDEVLPEDAHKIATNRVYISVTRKKCGKNFIISEFPTRKDLIQCLVSSCHIPFYSGSEYPIFRGEKYYDGGFTNNLVTFEDDETLLITPFSGGQSYICPEDPINKFNVTINNQDFCVNTKNISRGIDAMFPPSLEQLDRYFEQGFIAGLRYMVRMSKDHPTVFQPNQGGITPRAREMLLTSMRRKSHLKKMSKSVTSKVSETSSSATPGTKA